MSGVPKLSLAPLDAAPAGDTSRSGRAGLPTHVAIIMDGNRRWAEARKLPVPLGQDEVKHWSEEVQKLTDQFIKLVDSTLADKEKDIRQV